MSLKGKVAIVTRGGIRLEQDGAAIAVWNLNAAGAAETVEAIVRAGDRLRRRRVGPGRVRRTKSCDADTLNGAACAAPAGNQGRAGGESEVSAKMRAVAYRGSSAP